MVLALGLVHSQQALEAQKAVNDATNKMLQRNSELLRSSSTKIAIENERAQRRSSSKTWFFVLFQVIAKVCS